MTSALSIATSPELRSPLVADADTVLVWSLRLEPAGVPPEAWAVLDERERTRADRFRSPADRARYVVRHAFYRRVLARCLGTEPEHVGIRVSPTGKPVLADTSLIDFNTSHTTDMAVIALARGRRVGVDIERARELADVLELAAAHLTQREQRLVRSADPRSRSSTFLAIWTAKEAAVKALGVGLSMPLDAFDTGVSSDDPAVACRIGGTTLALTSMLLDERHIGTVAVEGGRIEVHHVAIPEEPA